MTKKKSKSPIQKGEIEVKVNAGPIINTTINNGQTTVKEVLTYKIKQLKWRIYVNGIEVTNFRQALKDGDFLLLSGEVS